MKSILNYLKENNIQESQKIDESAFTPEIKKQIQDLKNEIENIVKKMDIGDFKFQNCSADTLYLGLDNPRRFGWDIRFNMHDLNDYRLEFGSIASYGSFSFEDTEVYKMYKSIGIVLSQEKELKQIEEIFAKINDIIMNIE